MWFTSLKCHLNFKVYLLEYCEYFDETSNDYKPELQGCNCILIISSIAILLPFRRFRKFAKSDYYLRHICPSVLRVEQLVSPWRDFQEI
jgi:hypothetical protein